MKYIFKDLLDDMTPMRTSTNPLSDSTDTSPDYTDASYYDIYVLSTTKHIDDFSQAVAFPNPKDDSLGTIF